jgi:Bax protein
VAIVNTAFVRGVIKSPRFIRLVKIVAVVAVMMLGWHWLTHEKLPDFSDYENTKAKKAAFFGYLLPKVQAVNAEIMDDRERLLKIRDQLSDSDSAGFFDDRFLKEMARYYSFKDIPEKVDQAFAIMVLKRVDVISPSLVLAQAANESGWGTSRFARQGNNLFGMHAHDGSGMVPQRRGKGQTFTVAPYDTPQDSLDAYVHNLNTKGSYRQLRQIRASLRSRNATISGYALANGLMNYSERGSAYINELQSMIRSNNLAQYDE